MSLAERAASARSVAVTCDLGSAGVVVAIPLLHDTARIPPHLVGRVSSLASSMAWGLMPLGGLLGGVLVDGWGLTVALIFCGVAYVVVTMTPALDRTWREMDRRPAALA